MPTYTLAHIARLLQCPLPPTADSCTVRGVAMLEDAGPEDLSVVASAVYFKQFATTRAAAVIVQRKLELPQGRSAPILRVDDADLALAKVLDLFAPPVLRPEPGVDRSARVDPSAQLGAGVAVGPNVVVSAGCRVGAKTVLHAGVYLGEQVELGASCELFPNVVVRERIAIGQRVVIHAGSVLGTDGFGYRWDGSKQVKIPQIGTVIVEDDVEIGSCVCIDRAKVGATLIGHGTKIDNLVQIAHNVRVGPDCIVAGQSGIAGSAILGRGVVLGGRVAVRDHVTIGDGVMVAALSAVADDIPARKIVSGMPAIDRHAWLREQVSIRRLPKMAADIRLLKEQVEQLQRSAKPEGRPASPGPS